MPKRMLPRSAVVVAAVAALAAISCSHDGPASTMVGPGTPEHGAEMSASGPNAHGDASALGIPSSEGNATAEGAIAEGHSSSEGGRNLPLRLSQTGLYAEDGSVDPRNLAFSPQYPLWSDGATKARWIYLPAGAKIDVSDLDAWRFPEGTTLWKEFAWGGRKVETRMIRKTSDDWVFASYVWTEDQSDALLAPESGVPGVVEIAPGKRHSIPSLLDCNACHRSSPATVLGFTALQLSDERDPLAPHAEPLRPGMITLSSLLQENRLDPPRPELAQRQPRIRASDPTARAAMGYVSANCGGCHNASGPVARLGLVLLHDAAGDPKAPEPALATAVDVAGRYVVPGVAPADSRIVAPGAPERSALLYRMHSRRPSSQMPPLGTLVADDEAIELVTRWITELGTGPGSGSEGDARMARR